MRGFLILERKGTTLGYRANRGGHAPGYLREALEEYLDGTDEGSLSDTIKVDYGERIVSLKWLLGQLWNCTDILPGSYCDHLDLEFGSSYAMAVRKMAAEFEP